jgi:hypothetical protein
MSLWMRIMVVAEELPGQIDAGEADGVHERDQPVGVFVTALGSALDGEAAIFVGVRVVMVVL